MRFPNSVFLSLLVALCACTAQAGDLEDICGRVFRKLDSASHESLTQSMGSFAYNGNRHTGCVIRLSGDAILATDTQIVDHLFGLPLPYCPGGKLPADLPRDMVNPDGWCGDAMADGPDGASYRALRKNIFCAVEGSWDGGDDTDPAYLPSPHYEVTVKCAHR